MRILNSIFHSGNLIIDPAGTMVPLLNTLAKETQHTPVVLDDPTLFLFDYSHETFWNYASSFVPLDRGLVVVTVPSLTNNKKTFLDTIKMYVKYTNKVIFLFSYSDIDELEKILKNDDPYLFFFREPDEIEPIKEKTESPNEISPYGWFLYDIDRKRSEFDYETFAKIR